METKNVLLQKDEYNGKYVALKSFEDSTVVAYGMAPDQVMKEAEAGGYSDAVLVFVPENDMTHVY
ncbi:MAG TPA: DUF5678 domain-containing protein [Desulfatiglandales bacterium]|nr:DUF5678 domain-containing protein [Desulfatiglandales bacterium]